MPRPFFLVGPTAVGKTELAVRLAEHLGAEIVGADAYQVYQGFDLLTAKPSADQRRRASHHLVGCVPTQESYNVARYLEAARGCIAEIEARGKPALVVGGSGLYVKALTHGLATLPEPLPSLRAELDSLTSPELLAKLAAHDPATVATIDVGNKRRLVRALEVCLLTGRPFSSFRTEWLPSGGKEPVRGVFLLRERADLLGLIARRTQMIVGSQVLQEVRDHPPESMSPTSERILGLNELRAHLADAISLQTCRERLEIATRQYAKRQTTWFKREACCAAINLTEIADPARQLEEILSVFRAAQAP